MLSDALLSSPVIVGEDGSGAAMPSGFEFGVDPNEDPELALVIIFYCYSYCGDICSGGFFAFLLFFLLWDFWGVVC